MNYDKSHSHLISLELSEELKKEEIIQKFVKNNRINSLELSLNHKYKQKTLVFTIPSAKKMDWIHFIGKISRSLQKSSISLEHIIMIEDVINSNHDIIFDLNDSLTQDGDTLKKLFVRKYTANGSIPLHESVVFTDSGKTAFVYLDDDGKLGIVASIDRPDKILYPTGSLDSQNPLPYTFASPEELQLYIGLAKNETFDSLYQQVKSELKKYVNIDEHYLVVIAADIIFSYFQDKFPTVHYDVFVGDNGSGKNSALLVISRLGYRVFYVVSASAANYFTFYGDVEECQGTIAEDEAGDLDREYEKQKILKSGYTSGGTVPKIDFVNGKRSQAPYNVYGMKWIAMEELPDSRKTRGIFDRSLVFKCIAGHVDYNIKDIIRHAGEQKFKPLYDKLIHLHKLLFASRLLHYNDTVLDIQLNIENRNAELTKPLLRLFCSENHTSVAVEEIRLALSKFIAEKNELKLNSIEAAMYVTVTELMDEVPMSEESNKSDIYEFINEQISNKFKKVINGMDIRVELLYSSDHGAIPHKRLTSLFKSKFRAVSFKTSGSDSKRGLRFSKEIIDKIGLQYKNEDEIRILSENGLDTIPGDKSASDASDASLFTSAYPVLPLEQVSEKSIDNSIDPDNSRSCEPDNLTEIIANPSDPTTNSTAISAIDINNNNNKKLTNLSSDVVPATTNSSQINLYSNNAYAPVKSDASDASDASSILHKNVPSAKTKAEEVGLPEIPCLYCDFKDPIAFDLSLHYLEKHRQQLIRLPIGKSSIDNRADYAVELSKKKLLESFEDEDEDEDESEIDDDDE